LITAKDDGKGFDISAASNGIGLQTMQKRAEQLNAGYQLKSEVGKGTTLTLKLPLAK
jgi:signal transduction histidine kinase